MNRRFFKASITYLFLSSFFWQAAKCQDEKKPGILFCISVKADPSVKSEFDKLFQDWKKIPSIKALHINQEAKQPEQISSEELMKDYKKAAFNHLVIVGEKGKDPLLEKVWGFETLIAPENKTFYSQGWGHLKGDLALVESDRNPFLHSSSIDRASFETEIFKISGTDKKGVILGIKAFKQGLLNGLIAGAELSRPEKTLLDLDPARSPLPPALPPSVLETENGEAILCGWNNIPANEYRAYLDFGGKEPISVCRFKYLLPGALKEAGLKGWLEGFHRMAFGNSLTEAEFSSPPEAKAALDAILKDKRWSRNRGENEIWHSPMPNDEIMKNIDGNIYLCCSGARLLFCSLPERQSLQIFESYGKVKR
ncbi:MAG: hypothetical protein K2X27_04330 [Candidatus Obscuribacterales bacterium]|nr:hypothetical protein [Candidatus Obscuribacterales bacterium]